MVQKCHSTMTSFERKTTRIINKFNGGKFNLWKFKIKMLALMNLWDIVDGLDDISM